jgi:hypothetical protein
LTWFALRSLQAHAAFRAAPQDYDLVVTDLSVPTVSPKSPRLSGRFRALHYPPLADITTSVEFIETPTFTRLVAALLSDEYYSELQNELVEDPQPGDLIKGGGGIRKLRYALQGRGKSGGVRVIYYWVKDSHLIYMLVVYAKSKKDGFTEKETAILRNFGKEL